MLREDHRKRAAEPTESALDTPVPQPQEQLQPSDAEIRWRSTQHPEELVITGITQICSQCGARRDWMLMCLRNEVTIRCRCGHQWLEPELTRADFDSMIGTFTRTFGSIDEAVQSHGFDGTLAGVYLNERRPA